MDSRFLTGTWRLEHVRFNQIEGTEINDWISTSTILSIQEDKAYFRNYVAGTWSLEDNTLTLDPGATFPNFYWEYEVLELTEEVLEVRISLTEGEYCCNFDEFEEDEVLVITERYVRTE